MRKATCSRSMKDVCNDRNVEDNVVDASCYGGSIEGVQMRITKRSKIMANIGRAHEETSREIAPDLALPFTSGRRGTLDALNRHSESSAILAFVVVALGSLATATVAFLERKRRVRKRALSAAKPHGALLSALIVLELII